MAETGYVNRFPAGRLDPSAEEFRPRNPNPTLPFFTSPPPPPPYYQYPPPPPPPPETMSTLPYVIRTPIPPPAAAPTRAVLLKPVPCDVSEVIVRMEMEVFGEVRWVQMERASSDGIVIVHFYDLRHAEKASAELRELHHHYIMQKREKEANVFSSSCYYGGGGGPLLGGEAWPQFVIPVNNAIPEGYNQGTIVIFNLDSNVTASVIKQTFQAFGGLKEEKILDGLRETPSKKHHKFVEFFDVRHAAMALTEMNGKEFYGKQIVIEFSRPGGNSWKKLNSLTSNIASPSNSENLRHAFSWGHSRFNAAASPRMFDSGFGNARVESPMAELSLGGSEDGAKKQNGQVIITSRRPTLPPPLPPSRSCRGKRGKQTKKYDARFLINEDLLIESSSDSRTTLMIKNIPNKYSQKLLLSMLDNHCIHCNDLILRNGDEDDRSLSSYDFIYLPIDFNNKCNVGYGFVNMTSPEATWRLYKAFHHQNWEVFNSRKICEVTYARVQGLEALKEHFKNSKFPREMDHCLPVVFTPPRDGKVVSDPQPIFGVQHKSGTAINSHPITLLLPPSHQHNHDDCSSLTGGKMGLNDGKFDVDDDGPGQLGA